MHPPVPPQATANGRRRISACLLLLGAILGDGIEDDTQVLGLTVTTVSTAGEYVQHSCGMTPDTTTVRRSLVPLHLRAEIEALAGKLIDLVDLPEPPGSLGMMP